MATNMHTRPGVTDQHLAQPAEGAVERALAVLCCFSRETPTLGVTEIAERLRLTKSTVHRLLQALVARGLVTQDAARQQYTLGYRVLALARAVPREADLRQICQTHMRWLLQMTQETIALYVGAGDVRICLDELESPQMLRMSAGIGRCFPLPRGAASRALLLDAPAAGDMWRRLASTLSSAESAGLLAELRAARERGFVVTMGETVAGAASVAAPIRGADGSIIAALSVGGPASRFGPEAVTRYAAALLEAVARIERDLAVALVSPASPAEPAARRQEKGSRAGRVSGPAPFGTAAAATSSRRRQATERD
ncbi:MAG TPA: IclR family transcriptional regulator [Ktedonobacterales bacterium]|nr:IclR family transcriptional regulator [Ktedonobacterales bacterium]